MERGDIAWDRLRYQVLTPFLKDWENIVIMTYSWTIVCDAKKLRNSLKNSTGSSP